jgi:hypothetical protein
MGAPVFDWDDVVAYALGLVAVAVVVLVVSH